MKETNEFLTDLKDRARRGYYFSSRNHYTIVAS